MGNFYVNYTLRGVSQKAVAAALAGRSAIITPDQNGCVVAFDEESDTQDGKVITELGSRLSRVLSCPVLAVLNHDDDILWYQLFESGVVTDEYDSSPGYFDPSAEPSGPAGGDAIKLCAAFEGNDAPAVENVLRKACDHEHGYGFAVERHADLVTALGLPAFAVGTGYRYVCGGELPEGLTETDLIKSS